MTTCREVMTEMPMCCLPDDEIDKAANIMRLADVGSVPVIEDHETKILLGIVTDRDVAVKAVAAPAERTVNVSDIMSKDPVVCHPEDDVKDVLKAMADCQVRRIPVVDGAGRLIGIIAQSDIATKVDNNKKTGEVVKEISKPA
jgi:CBS domain-containing protein